MNISRYSEICKTDDSLRQYQQMAKKEIFESWDKVDSVMFQMPTNNMGMIMGSVLLIIFYVENLDVRE